LVALRFFATNAEFYTIGDGERMSLKFFSHWKFNLIFRCFKKNSLQHGSCCLCCDYTTLVIDYLLAKRKQRRNCPQIFPNIQRTTLSIARNSPNSRSYRRHVNSDKGCT
jgi:hypothetical protein